LKGRAPAMQREGRALPAAVIRHTTGSAMSLESQDTVKFRKRAVWWVARSAGLSAIFLEASAERALARRLVKRYVTNDVSRFSRARRYGRRSSCG
jgi:hypothetical protein